MSMNDIIHLNVGGRRFVTTRETLCADPNSMLAKKFRSGFRLRSAPGSRRGGVHRSIDPDSFKLVLEYLRNGCRVVTDPPEDHAKSIRADADYYGLGV
mmetsp:Transcript_37648/g.69574  ORF Transcript_37648/g.69574 Transcript_37648/m.69574 type:complete len:98 (+) Transcript_37648:833-1126(+)